MPRKPRFEYTATADYGLKFPYACLGSYEKTLKWATDRIDEMRSAGASSEIRTVTMRRTDDWGRDTRSYSRPPILQASYYDADQGLTGEETYKARVHHWHFAVDLVNQGAIGSLRLGYRTWREGWGDAPTACPVCDAPLAPQNFYMNNGPTLTRLDGTRKRRGV
jgi:hypothetical protein